MNTQNWQIQYVAARLISEKYWGTVILNELISAKSNDELSEAKFFKLSEANEDIAKAINKYKCNEKKYIYYIDENGNVFSIFKNENNEIEIHKELELKVSSDKCLFKLNPKSILI